MIRQPLCPTCYGCTGQENPQFRVKWECENYRNAYEKGERKNER